MINAPSLEVQLQHQQTLAEAALTLSSTLDLNVLLSRVVQIAVDLLGVEGAAILLPDDTRTYLHLRAHQGAAVAQDQIRFDIETSSPGSVFRTEEVLVTSGERHFFSDRMLEALVYIPLRVRRLVIGVLCVYHAQNERLFSDYELEVLEKLAAHAAVAIENAKLYHSSQARSFELALIIDATEAVNSTLSLPRVLSLIGKNLLQALQAECCEVHICNPDSSTLSAWSFQSNSIWQPDYAETLRLPPELAGRTQWLDLQAEMPGMEPFLTRAQRTVLIPLWQDGDFLGAVQLAFTTPRLPRFDEQAINRAALSVAHSALNQQITRALHLIRQLRREALADWCNFWMWDSEIQMLRLTVGTGDAVWFKEPYPTQPMSSYPTFKTAIEQQAISSYSRFENDIPLDIQQVMEQMHAHVLMVVPLIIQNSNSGIVLIAHNRREEKYDSREINLAHALVLQAANAIKNAQLYGDLQNSLEELRRTQAQLVQAARLSAIGQLAAAVAHQINNPLTTVLADSQIVLEDLDEQDRNYEGVKAIRRAGQRAHEVVKRLLTIARPKSENDPPEPMDINLTIRNTLALVESTLYRSRVQLQLDLPDKLPRAYGIPGQLEDVWLNLIINARDALATYKNPVIGVTSRYNPELNAVQVEIWDNGPGIEPDNKKVFEAFYTTKPPGEGTGLGLYICKHVVETCGGEMHIDANYREGAKFIVTLPCANEQIASVD